MYLSFNELREFIEVFWNIDGSNLESVQPRLNCVPNYSYHVDGQSYYMNWSSFTMKNLIDWIRSQNKYKEKYIPSFVNFFIEEEIIERIDETRFKIKSKPHNFFNIHSSIISGTNLSLVEHIDSKFMDELIERYKKFRTSFEFSSH
jgi:hypothetical protein